MRTKNKIDILWFIKWLKQEKGIDLLEILSLCEVDIAFSFGRWLDEEIR